MTARQAPAPSAHTTPRGFALSPRGQAAVMVAAALACALLTGALTGLYGSTFNSRPSLIAALPLALALLLCFAINRTALLMLILFFRAVLDPVLSATKVNAGPGLGGVMNALILLLVVSLFFEKERKPPFQQTARMWLPFLLAFGVGVLLTPIRGEAVRTLLSLLTFPAAFLVGARNVRNQRDFDRLAIFLVASAVAVQLYCLIGMVTHEALYRVFYWTGTTELRLTGPLPHPNILAFYEVMMMALSLYLLQGRARIQRRSVTALAAFVLFSGLVILLMTKTRSAWVAAYLLFMMYGLFVDRRVLLLVLIAPVAMLSIPEIRERLVDLQSGNEAVGYAKLNSYAWRKLLWHTALHWMVPSHYLLGYGANSFMLHSSSFFPLAGETGPGPGAHNVYVQVLFELGVVGLLAFVWLFFCLLRSAWQMTHGATRNLQLFLIIMFMVICWSDNLLGYLVFNLYLFYVLGAGWSMARLHPRTPPVHDPVQRRHRRTRFPAPWSNTFGNVGHRLHR